MKNFSIKQILLYGFAVLFMVFMISGYFMFSFGSKYETLYKKHELLKSAYHHMLEYKYFTERLLTTQNIPNETKLWIASKKRFEDSIDLLIGKQYLVSDNIVNFYNVIENESNKIIKKLQNKLFSEKNVMEKSILRRLGEGLNSNETSDYYLALTDLKNSLDYLKQYEEFLLDDITTLVNKEKLILDNKIYNTKLFGLFTLIFIVIAGGIIVYIVVKLIGKTEKNLIDIQNELYATNHTLKVQQNELNSIIDNIPSMIFVKDAQNLRFMRLNKSGEKLLELSEKELIGKNDYDLFLKEQADFFIQKDKEVIHSKKMISIDEEKINTPSGEKILHTKKVVICDNNNHPVYLLGISDDITEKKEQERVIVEQSKNAAMGEMIGNIAHQWRQPLSVISTGATGLKIQKEYGALTDDDLFKTCDAINDNAQYLSRTIDDFKNFIKGQRKKEFFNLEKNIESFLSLVKGSIKNNNINLEKNIDSSITINSYPNELIQCYMNIFNNSKDALKHKDKDRYFFITTYKKDDTIIITFQDNAGGIPNDILPHIFEPYFTTKHKSKGTGLGLSMTYSLITKGMKGSISAKNVTFDHLKQSYKGAQFIITLPLS